MSKLIIDEEDVSNKIKDLSFSCGICGSNNTCMDLDRGFVYDGGGSVGSLILSCLDCKAGFSPFYDDEWKKLK